jgi:hypothetical protein
VRQILFFGLKEDLVTMLELVEQEGRLRFFVAGNSRRREIEHGVPVYDSGAEIPGLGNARADECPLCDSYVVCELETPVILRTLVDCDSEERVLVDQLSNPDSVTFSPGGAWDESVILNGRVATVSDSPPSQALMRRFMNALRKTFTRVGAYHVGPKALSLLKAGARLACAGVQSPPEFDLKLPTKCN